jgi:hypothetical protein
MTEHPPLQDGKDSENALVEKGLGDLVDARGFYDRGAALAISEAGGFFFVGVDAAEGFAVGITDGDKEMMMTAATVFAEFGFFIADGLFG